MTKRCSHLRVGKRLIAVVSLLLGLVVGAPAAHAQMCSDVCHADSDCGTSCVLDDKVCTAGWNASDPDSVDPDGTSMSCPDDSAYDTSTWSSCSAYTGGQCGMGPLYEVAPGPVVDLGNLSCPPATGIDVNKNRSHDDNWTVLAGGFFHGANFSARASSASWSGGVFGGYRVKLFSSDWSEVLRGQVSMNVKYHSDRYDDVTLPWSLKLFDTIVYSGTGLTANGDPSWDLGHVDRTDQLSRSVPLGSTGTWLGPVWISISGRATFGASVQSAADKIVDQTNRTRGSYIQIGPTGTVSATCSASASVGVAAIGVDGTVNLVAGSLTTRIYAFGEGNPLLNDYNVKWYHEWSAQLRFVEGKLVGWLRILFKKWKKDLWTFGPAMRLTWGSEPDAGCARFAVIDATASDCRNAGGPTACQGGCSCTTCRNSLGLLVDCPSTCTTTCSDPTPVSCYQSSGAATSCSSGCDCSTCYNSGGAIVGCPWSCTGSCGGDPVYCYDADSQQVSCESRLAATCYDANWSQVPCPGRDTY